MAQARSKKSSASGGKKSTSARSRSTSGSAASKSKTSRRAQRRAESTNLVRSVVLAGLGLLCIALVLVPGANFWKVLREAAFGVFGITMYLVGPILLYFAYLLASGYRIGLFAAKVALLGVLFAGVPVVFSEFAINGASFIQIVKMLFAWGQTRFWTGGVLGMVGALLLALVGRPAANVLVALVFVLGLMVFFAVTPADVVQYLQYQYDRVQQARTARAEAQAPYDTPLFGGAPEEEPIESLTETLPDPQPQASAPAAQTTVPYRRHPAYDVAADPAPRAEAPLPPQEYDPAAPRADFDIDLGPASGGAAPAVDRDPLERVDIGPGGTFGMDPLANLTRTETRPAPAAPQNDFELHLDEEAPARPADADELDELVSRAMGPRTAYYPPQSVPSEVQLELPVSSEVQLELPVSSEVQLDLPEDFATRLTPPAADPAAPAFGTAQYYGYGRGTAAEQADEPVLDFPPRRAAAPQDGGLTDDLTPDVPEGAQPVQIPPVDMTGRTPGDTVVLSPDDLAAALQAGRRADGLSRPAASAGSAAPNHSTAASGAAIPAIGGSFDAADPARAAWNAGVPVAELLAGGGAAAAHTAQTGTAAAFAPPPQGGESAKVRVSAAVGNSASAPISTPAAAARRPAPAPAGRQAEPDEEDDGDEALDLAAMQRRTAPPAPYCYPSLNLFNTASAEDEAGAKAEMRRNADVLVKTLDSFGVGTKILDIARGPSVTRYELQPQAGIKVSRITSLADDIALNLATAGVRIEAPIPGKPAVGIEVPNKIRSTVNIRTVFESQNYINMRSPLTMALGKDIAGSAQVADLCKMPHLLIAGSTGSGKSVCVNSVIISFLFRSGPEDVKLLLIDPKVVELAEYNGIPHLLMPVVTEPRKAAGALGASVAEMERRYKLFAENNVREIKAYNKLAARKGLEHLPYIAIVIDELADLMMVAGKEVEDYICRIAQKARAAGIHLIVATQRPSVDVITGLIKANIPSRIAFAVSSQIDSRTILDSGGAEKLLGNGDMLFLPVGASKPVRVQGTFVTDEEISAVLSFIKSTSEAQYDEEMIAEMERRAVAEKGSKKGGDEAADDGAALDPMFEQAVECVIEAGQASTSLLQRRCKLGYARAARIMDQMEQAKVIGPYEGAKPRSVLITQAEWQERKLNGALEG